MVRKLILNLFFVSYVLSSCSLPKDILTRINSNPREMVDLPIYYCFSLPTLIFTQWDKDYNVYDKFLTREIMKTQIGITSTHNGIQTWWIYPSARTHTQLDTVTLIKNSKEVIGDWRIISNRLISFTDSAVYAEEKFYRNHRIIYDEKDADIFLTISVSKFNMYGTEKGEYKYKRGVSSNYSIINGRFLLLYGASKATGAISQIGIDKDGCLIINSYWIQERKLKNEYITYESRVTQLVFKRQ